MMRGMSSGLLVGQAGERCGLFDCCKSPSKKETGWACTASPDCRRRRCVIFVAFFAGGDVAKVISLEKKMEVVECKEENKE